MPAITTPRIVLSPKAYAVAAAISPRIQHGDFWAFPQVWLADVDLADECDLKPATVYKALTELEQLGALNYVTRSSQGQREVHVNLDSWVWAAVAQTKTAGA